MKKQTKLLSLLFGFVLLLATMLTGCQNINADVSLIENTFYTHTIYSESSGKVTENIVINFDVFNSNDTDINSVINSVFQTCLIQKTLLENEFNQKINANAEAEITTDNFAIATERKNNKIAFTIYFYTQTAWKFFNSLSNVSYTPEIIERLFDYTRIDRKDMIGTVTSLAGNEQYFGNYLKNWVFTVTNSIDDTLISSLTTTSVYSYATPYSRRNSNAPYIATYQGLYFHMWNTTNNDVEFEFWYNLARVESWYILSIIIAFLTVIIILIVSHFKKEQKNITAENIVEIENALETNKNDNVLIVDETEKDKAIKKQVADKIVKEKKVKKTAIKKEPKKRIKTKDE